MREAGMPVELVADRLGHGDGGALLLRTDRHDRAGETRAALDAIGTGLRAAANVDRKQRVQPSARPAAPTPELTRRVAWTAFRKGYDGYDNHYRECSWNTEHNDSGR
jgi:hypothetical protein